MNRNWVRSLERRKTRKLNFLQLRVGYLGQKLYYILEDQKRSNQNQNPIHITKHGRQATRQRETPSLPMHQTQKSSADALRLLGSPFLAGGGAETSEFIQDIAVCMLAEGGLCVLHGLDRCIQLLVTCWQRTLVSVSVLFPWRVALWASNDEKKKNMPCFRLAFLVVFANKRKTPNS